MRYPVTILYFYGGDKQPGATSGQLTAEGIVADVRNAYRYAEFAPARARVFTSSGHAVMLVERDDRLRPLDELLGGPAAFEAITTSYIGASEAERQLIRELDQLLQPTH